MKLLTLIILITSVSFGALANEKVMPESVLLEQGYLPFKAFNHFRGFARVSSELPTNIPWPVQFIDPAHNIAQNYVNFQQYGSLPYYHKGCDLRTKARDLVRAPVTGILEGGYYGYTDNPDGSETKHWIPWNGQVHDDPYFELAIITADGYRFELHHVDSTRLPQSTIDALNKGGVVIPAGTVIGTVIPWGMNYDHIHYNIYRQDGVIVNPEFYSAEVPDHVAPTIQGVYGIKPNGQVIQLQQNASIPGGFTEFVVATTETRDQSVYVQTPPFIGIKFDNGATTVWDFRKALLGPDNKWPDLRQVFTPELRLPNGSRLRTSGQYGQGLFLMRLKLPTQTGRFSLKVGDTAGNFATFEGTLL